MSTTVNPVGRRPGSTVITPKSLKKLAPTWTCTKLANKTGFSVPTISRIFNGDRWVTRNSLNKIAKALGKTDAEVMTALAKIKRNGKG